MKGSIALVVAASEAGKSFLAEELADLLCEGIDVGNDNKVTLCYCADAASRGFTNNGNQGLFNAYALELLCPSA